MSKQKVVLLVLTTALLGGGIVYFFLQNKAPSSENEPLDTEVELEEMEQEDEFSVRQERITEETDEYSIDATYPVFSSESQEIQAISSDIESQVQSMVSAFKRDQVEFGSSNLPFDAESTLDISYRTTYDIRGYISIPMSVTEYMAGAAHPNNYLRTFVYDKKTGEEVELDDLFSSEDYLEQLSSLSREVLENEGVVKENNMETSDWFFEGTAPDEQNFQMFYLTPEHLVIVFNPYQIAPFAAGVIEAEIPLSRLVEFET